MATPTLTATSAAANLGKSSTMNIYGTADLVQVALTFPAIDNHAHPLLKAEHRNAFPFEGLISEATGPALLEDAVHTLACYRATQQLSKLYRLSPGEPSWEAVKHARQTVDYEVLCRACMTPTSIQCILIDDGLGGSADLAEGYKWHDRFTSSPTKRIVRVEVLAESVLKKIFDTQLVENDMNFYSAHMEFRSALTRALQESGADPEVAGFKSIACYRTGLDIAVVPDLDDDDHFTQVEQCVTMVYLKYEATRALRLADKALNDYIVNLTLQVAGNYGKPVQFHTGLGDNDITLSLASPAAMQPIIKAYPSTKIVLLHSSYPFTREAGYLTAVYPNVFLDFGEVFPFLSAEGQAEVVKQVLELCPTNKIMWSTDGHWWPESYFLGTVQARETLWKVLAESVHKQEMTEAQAIGIVKRALFHNANKIYNLNLEAHWVPQ